MDIDLHGRQVCLFKKVEIKFECMKLSQPAKQEAEKKHSDERIQSRVFLKFTFGILPGSRDCQMSFDKHEKRVKLYV